MIWMTILKPIGTAIGPILKFVGKYWRELLILFLVWFLWNRTEDLRAAETDRDNAIVMIDNLAIANHTTETSLDTCLAVNKENEQARYNAEIRAIRAETRVAELELTAANRVDEIDEQADAIRETAPQECVFLHNPMPDYFLAWVQD